MCGTVHGSLARAVSQASRGPWLNRSTANSELSSCSSDFGLNVEMLVFVIRMQCSGLNGVHAFVSEEDVDPNMRLGRLYGEQS